MWKGDLNLHVFQNRNWCSPKIFLTLNVRGPFHRKDFKWKKWDVRGYILKKRNLWIQNIEKELKQPPVVILQQSIFTIHLFGTCGSESLEDPIKVFSSWIFLERDFLSWYRTAISKKSSLWLLPYYVAVATYCCYEKVRRTMHTAILSYLLKRCCLFLAFLSRNSLLFMRLTALQCL